MARKPETHRLTDDPQWGRGFIVDWLFCGPFFYGYTDRPEDELVPYDDDYLRHPGGEGKVRPAAGDTVETEEGCWSWEARHSASIRANLTQELGPGPFLGRATTSFAATYVEFDRACTGLLWLGSSDGFRLYVNGRMVHDILGCNRAALPDQNVYRIKWRRGRNLVLLRARCNRFGSQLIARLTDEKRRPVRAQIVLPKRKGYVPAAKSLRSGPGYTVPREAPVRGDWIRVPTRSIRGGEKTPPVFAGVPDAKGAVLLESGGTARAKFTFPAAVTAERLLTFQALNYNASLEVKLNGKTVWEGTPPQLPPLAPGKAAGERVFVRSNVVIPRGMLRRGRNTVSFAVTGLGSGAWMALKNIAVLREEEDDSHAGWSAVRFSGERFGAASRVALMPDVGDWPDTGGHCFVSAKNLADIPSSGGIHADFVVPKLPGRRGDELECVLHLKPLNFIWPWVLNHPRERGKELPSPYSIEINGIRVNNVRRDALNLKQRILAPLLLPVPARALKQGLNRLSIRVLDETAASTVGSGSGRTMVEPGVFASRRPVVEEVVVRWRRRPQFLGVPRVAHPGRPFEVVVNLPRKEKLVSVKSRDGLVFLGKVPALLGPGEVTLRFKAARVTEGAGASLEFARRTLRFRVGRVSDIPDPDAVKFTAITALDAPADDIEGHRLSIAAVKRNDMANTLHFRNLMPEATPVSVVRRVIRMHKEAGLFLSYSWGPFEVGPGNKYTVKDVARWCGRHLDTTGSTRNEPPVRRYKNLLDLHKTYTADLRKHYRQNPHCAFHPNQAWFRYGAAAGAGLLWYQEGYTNIEWHTGSMRGAARAYGNPTGVTACDDCSLIYWVDDRARRIAALYNWIAFIDGCETFIPEMSGKWMIGWSLPWHGGYIADPVHRVRYRMETDFYDFARTRVRAGRLPLAPLGFVQGRLDGWDGMAEWLVPCSETGYQEGYYMPGRNLWRSTRCDPLDRKTSHWPYGIAESGWRYMDVAMRRLKFGQYYAAEHPKHEHHWFCGTPYGKTDLVPGDLTSHKPWLEYRALVFPGWNSATEKQYRMLRRYVTDGGTLFMAVPQLTTSVVHGKTDPLVRRGRWQDLFGVTVKGRSRGLGSKAIRTPAGRALLPRRVYPLENHPRNPLYASKLQLSDDVTVLSKTEKGVPLLVERKLGRGRAILLTAWNFPGEEAFDRMMRDLIGSIASEVALPVRVEPSDYINHGVFVEKGGEPGRDLTTIYFTDTRWWEPGERELPASLTLDGRAFPLKVPPARIRSVAWRGRLAVCAEDHMVYVSSLEEDSSATFTMTAQGTGTSALRLMFLDGRPKRITQAGRTVPFRWDPKTRVATMKVRWHGEDVIRVESVTKRAAR